MLIFFEHLRERHQAMATYLFDSSIVVVIVSLPLLIYFFRQYRAKKEQRRWARQKWGPHTPATTNEDHPVRKARLIFLLAVLPIQFVLGAAAAYCRHELGVEVSHFGHRSHKHVSKADKASEDSVEKRPQAGGDDAGCIVCHMSRVTFVSEAQRLQKADQVAYTVPIVRRDHSRLPVPSIEQPQMD